VLMGSSHPLGDPEDFFEGGDAAQDLFDAVILEGGDAFFQGFLFDAVGIVSFEDQALQVAVHDHDFKYTGSAPVAGLKTQGAALCPVHRCGKPVQRQIKAV